MGYVSDYLVDHQDLNHTVACTGQAFRDQFDGQLSHNIVNMMYMFRLILEGHHAFQNVVGLLGHRVEEIKRRAKARNFVEAKPQTNTKETSKEKFIHKNKDNRKGKKQICFV
jgi:hypothetical protein